MRNKASAVFAVFVFAFLGILSGCASHLHEAKLYYAEGDRHARSYLTSQASVFYRKALEEAQKEVARKPSGQAYMVMGLAELNLEMWKEAEDSFHQAFIYGFEAGEEWAGETSLLGLALTLDKNGLEDQAQRTFLVLLEKSKLKPVSLRAAQEYMEGALKRALVLEDRERQKALKDILSRMERLAARDFSTGFTHYLISQVSSYLQDFRRSYEEAVIARELGLPSERVFRDNDLQIVHCYRELKERLSSEEFKDFLVHYRSWIEKWGWQDESTPSWKREERHAADD